MSRKLIREICQKVFLLQLLFVMNATEATTPEVVPVIKDLRVEAQLAADNRLPILVLFSMTDCEFCEMIRSEYLQPMHNNPAYRNKVIVREIVAENFKYLRDINGELVSADTLALRYSADLSPTVVFMDAQGKMLVKSIVGIVSRDYYDKKLDDAIAQSLIKLGRAP